MNNNAQFNERFSWGRTINAVFWLYLWLSAVLQPLANYTEANFWSLKAQQAISLNPVFVRIIFDPSGEAFGELAGQSLILIPLLLIDRGLRRKAQRRDKTTMP